MEDFLKFRKMVTPAIIQVLFWIGVAVCVVAGIITMIYSFDSYVGGVGVFLSGLLIFILGPILVRISCELMIVFFQMNENLAEIKASLAKK